MSLEDIVHRLEKEIPGYNRRPFTYNDLEQLCSKEGIILIETELPSNGMLICRAGEPPCVFLNRNLSPPGYKAFIGFHEYFHYRFHPGSIHIYLRIPSWHNQIEYQAHVLAALAIIPTPCLVRDLRIGENIAEKYGVPEFLVAHRLKILEEYRNLLMGRGLVLEEVVGKEC
ncbi:MAG: hypothetical protein DRP02_14270 [Candidatus Gerdarchaeota archaeon]|nr:MAG: hypothetical protein DRP02_14270 [Candidatus Gerdarchaeota archaeon]